AFSSITNPIPLVGGNNPSDPYRKTSPVYQYGDNLTGLVGRHTLKAGIELRFSSANQVNSASILPRATLGQGSVPVLGIAQIAGIGQN
ncbi:hypothetical protein, partial [Salmonella sp. SAL4446]|uniref:hypothetical protein n=1 Tax=Salmonella sp. SAL4446 TaxID=3159901 RepID=UPI00397E68E5